MTWFRRELLKLLVPALLKKLSDQATQNDNYVGFFNVLLQIFRGLWSPRQLNGFSALNGCLSLSRWSTALAPILSTHD